MQKQNYHHGNLREALLNAAESLIARGSDELSLRSVAKLAGVSHSAPYRHFKSWSDIQWHVKERILGSVSKELSITAIGELSSATKIQRFAKKLIETAILEPQKFQILSTSLSTPDGHGSGQTEEIFKILLKLVVQHLHEEELREQQDPFKIASTVWCSIFGIAHLTFSGWIPFDKKSIYSEKLLITSLQTILP